VKRFHYHARVRDPFGETRPTYVTGLVAAVSVEVAITRALARVEENGDSVRNLGVDAIPGCAIHFEVSPRTFAFLIGEEFDKAPERVATAIARRNA
jgi:hypothetical protein